MKILHAYCLNYNIGDYALGVGVKNLLRDNLDIDLIAETNLQGTVFNEYFINNVVNKNYDMLVIGGGGVIHGAHWPNGWFWLIEQKLLKQIEIPFIVYGVGYNYFIDEGGMPEVGKAHLTETIERAAFFSVRNDESIDRLKSQIAIGDKVNEIPDPGFHINLNRTYECLETEPFIVVQLAYDKPEHRFGSTAKIRLFVRELVKSLSPLSERYKIIFAPHVFDDIELSKLVSQEIENSEIWDFGGYAFDRCDECYGYYEKAKFVLAMRGHGQIIPIAFNTPVISLENHPKHSGLMRKLGLEKYNVKVTSDNFSTELSFLIAELERDYDSYIERLIGINKNISQWSKDAFGIIRQALVNKDNTSE